MDGIDPGQAIDAASRTLAVIVSAVGLVVVVSQWTRPAILKRRAKWLQEALETENNESRVATLNSLLQDANAAILAGVMVPGWRFLPLLALMLLGPVQAVLWARNDPSFANVLGALGVTLALTATPIRRGIRLLAERFRVGHEYRAGEIEVRAPRFGSLNQMEGGTRRETTFALAAALGVNSLAVGLALAYLDQVLWGLLAALAGALLTVTFGAVITSYARKRAHIYGPWSVEDPRL